MVENVGIISPGDMGSAIGKVLVDSGVNVITALDGRSELTRLRAREAGMRDVGTLDILVEQSELILSVLVPAEALPTAVLVSESMRHTHSHPVYADLNAIAPQTVREIGRSMGEAGVVFVDGGIIGSPPGPGKVTRIYCSGPDTSAVESLRSSGLDIRRVGPEIGQASGLKMVYAASTKGITALWTELMVAAELLGLQDALAAEFRISGVDIGDIMKGRVCTMPRRARRWVGEMEEIATTFESVGLTPRMLQGAADMYRLVSTTPLADQTSRQPDPSPAVLLKVLAARAGNQGGGRDGRDFEA
jgi:3-hydroxyisobutyrate dehydrogenase-like beta-hydroxyacid dehydrogenase